MTNGFRLVLSIYVVYRLSSSSTSGVPLPNYGVVVTRDRVGCIDILEYISLTNVNRFLEKVPLSKKVFLPHRHCFHLCVNGCTHLCALGCRGPVSVRSTPPTV